MDTLLLNGTNQGVYVRGFVDKTRYHAHESFKIVAAENAP